MRALVVYESMYGNTHVIASNIEDGLRATHEVILIPVAAAAEDLVRPDIGIRPFGYLTSMVITIGLWLTLAPAAGAIARATKKK
jgi:hypothetical protein